LARPLKRVFNIDMQHCPNCGAAELKIIAAILERPVIEKILSHLGLDPHERVHRGAWLRPDTNSAEDCLWMPKRPGAATPRTTLLGGRAWESNPPGALGAPHRF